MSVKMAHQAISPRMTEGETSTWQRGNMRDGEQTVKSCFYRRKDDVKVFYDLKVHFNTPSLFDSSD